VAMSIEQSDMPERAISLARSLHRILSFLLEKVSPEDESGSLTPEYIRLTAALQGCNTIIDQLEGTVRNV